MTHAQKAADIIVQRTIKDDGYLLSEEMREIIQTHAIKPAVDEATRELKETLCKIAKGFGYHGILACEALGIDHTQNAVKVIEDITAAENLLKK